MAGEASDLMLAHTSTLAVNLLDANSVLSSFGVLGIFVILFAETGLLIGFFLPGDSLLFTAGLLCTTKVNGALHLSLPAVLIAAAGGALLGAQVGYLVGRRVGPTLTERRSNPRLQAAVTRARAAFTSYGYPKAIVFARFIPFVRTVMNPLAGVMAVPVRVFLVWQIIGGIIWSVGVCLAGYGLGSRIPSIDTYLLPIIALIVALSLIPVALEVRRSRAGRRVG